jgi:hypothetical protein
MPPRRRHPAVAGHQAYKIFNISVTAILGHASDALVQAISPLPLTD